MAIWSRLLGLGVGFSAVMTATGEMVWRGDRLSEWDMGNYRDAAANAAGISGVTEYQAGVTTPYLFSPELNVAAAECNLLEIRLKAASSGRGRLFFAVPGQALADERRIEFTTPGGDDQWHWLRIPLRHAQWTGIIGRLRLDLLFQAGIAVEIAEIRLLKLTGTDGEVLRNPDWQLRDGEDGVEGWRWEADGMRLTQEGNALAAAGTGGFRLIPDPVYPDYVPASGVWRISLEAASGRDMTLEARWRAFDALEREIGDGVLTWQLAGDGVPHPYRGDLEVPPETMKYQLTLAGYAEAAGKTLLSGFSLREIKDVIEWSGEWIQPAPKEQEPDAMFFRYAFVLPSAARRGTLTLTADNFVEAIYLNGERVPLGPNARMYNAADATDVTGFLRQGANVLAIAAANQDSAGGVLADLDVELDDGQMLSLGTSELWQALPEAPDGWQEPDFDSSGWPAAASHGPTGKTAWGHLNKQSRPFSAAAAHQAEGGAAEARFVFNRDHAGMLEYAGKNTGLLHHWTGGIGSLTEEKIGFCRDYGIHWYFGTLTANWGGDYSGVDNFCERLLALDAEAGMNLLIAVDQSHNPEQRAWAEAHPEIWAQDADGNTRFRIHGTDSTVPSWASTVWLDEQCRRVRGLVEHIQAAPYRDRVLGLAPVSGMGFEWMYWGAFDTGGGVYRMDYSPAFRAGFQRWALAKYGTLAELNRRYRTGYAEAGEIALPTVEERDTGDWFGFLDPERSARTIDFREYISTVTAEAILALARTVKETSAGKMLFGTFYGYVTYVLFPSWSETGHFALDRILDAPEVDYLTCLTSYDTRRPGLEGGFMHPEGSFLLHGKTSFVQADTRTHRVSPEAPDAVYSRCADVRESAAVIKREFVNSLIAGCGYEFGYFGNGWIAEDRRLMQIIGRAREIELENTDVNRLDFETSIAVIMDDAASWFTAQKASQHHRLVTLQLPAFAHTGCGVDTFLLSDLERLPNYKCYVFLNTMVMTPEQETHIRETLERDGKVLVFVYAPGITGPDGIRPERVAALTGIAMEVREEEAPAQVTIAAGSRERFGKQYGSREPLGPVFVPQEGEVIGHNGATGLPALVRKQFAGHTVYYSAVPELSWEVLRAAAADAGINIANPNGADATYASDRLLGIHTAAGGHRVLQAPPSYRTKAVELFSGREYPLKDGGFEVELEPMSTVLFRFE